MANAFSGRITDDDISFNSTSYISTNSNWITDKGSVTKGNNIVMGSDSKCHLDVNFSSDKINYLKLQLRLSSDDTSLTTDNFHAVSGLYEIVTEDDNNILNTKNVSFYPKYTFEDDYIDDYTIVQLDSVSRLKHIKITLINKEEVTIKILVAGLYVSKVIDEETIEDIVEDNLVEAITTDPDVIDALDDVISDNMDNHFSDYYNDMATNVGTWIEPRTSDPSESDLFAGRIWLREDLVV